MSTTTISKLNPMAQRQLDQFGLEAELQVLSQSKWLTVYSHEDCVFAVDSEQSVFIKDDFAFWDNLVHDYGHSTPSCPLADLPEPLLYTAWGESQGVARTCEEAVKFAEHDNSFVEARVYEIHEETGLPTWGIYAKPHQLKGDWLHIGGETEHEAWHDLWEGYSSRGYTGGDNYCFETIASLQDELSQIIDDENEDRINEVKANINELQAAIDAKGKDA